MNAPVFAPFRPLLLFACAFRWAAAVLTAAPAAPPAPGPLWSVGGQWQGDSGAPVAPASFSGTPVVVAMFYTGCHVVCPVTVEAMQWVERNLPRDAARNCRFVLITLDPGGDTPGELRAFRREHGLSAQWTLLRASRRTTRAAADWLGVDYTAGEYRTSHRTLLVVLDGNGRVVARHTDLFPELRRLVSEVTALSR